MRNSLSVLAACGALTVIGGCSDAALPVEASGTPVVASVELSTRQVHAGIGDTVRVPARVRTRAGAWAEPTSLTWTTSDPGVAIVEDGLIVPIGVGRTRIVVQAPGGASASVMVNTWGGVRVTGISVDPDPLAVQVGETVHPTALLLYSNGNKVRLRSSLDWKSLNAGVATTSKGRVTGVGEGETRVVASLLTLVDTATLQVAGGTAVAPPPPTGGAAELPRVYLNTDVPAVTGRSIPVRAGDDLQAAINAAQPGDELVLEAGAAFVGPFTLPAKVGEAWITIRTAGTLPAPGTRVTPAHAAQMPKLTSRYRGEPVIATRHGAHHYRLIGLEVTAPVGETLTYTLLALGDGTPAQNTLEKQAHHLVLDRMYVHGTPTLNFQRCIALNSGATAIIDSWISECHGKGMDSQAIGGWNGTGPYKIVNNHLAGAGENVMFGGADPAIPNALPSDIEFRRNHVYKPLDWKGVWSVKNSFELKIGQRVLVEANVFENNWLDAQVGFAIVMKSTNQSGGAPWSTTRDVTFRYNVIRGTPHGMSLAGTPESHPAIPPARLHFAHNLFQGLSSDGGRLFQLSGVHGLTLDHNTGFGGFNAFILAGQKLEGLVVTNNVFGTSPNVVASAEGLGIGTAALDAHHTGPSWIFRGNVAVGARASVYPADNFYPATIADVGLVNFAAGDYRFRSDGRFARLAAGVDFEELADRTEGVVR